MRVGMMAEGNLENIFFPEIARLFYGKRISFSDKPYKRGRGLFRSDVKSAIMQFAFQSKNLHVIIFHRDLDKGNVRKVIQRERSIIEKEIRNLHGKSRWNPKVIMAVAKKNTEEWVLHEDRVKNEAKRKGIRIDFTNPKRCFDKIFDIADDLDYQDSQKHDRIKRVLSQSNPKMWLNRDKTGSFKMFFNDAKEKIQQEGLLCKNQKKKR